MYLLVSLAERAHFVAQDSAELGGIDGSQTRGHWHQWFEVVHEIEQFKCEGAVPLLSEPCTSWLCRKSLDDAWNTQQRDTTAVACLRVEQ